jgi:hypothetical protein
MVAERIVAPRRERPGDPDIASKTFACRAHPDDALSTNLKVCLHPTHSRQQTERDNMA